MKSPHSSTTFNTAESISSPHDTVVISVSKKEAPFVTVDLTADIDPKEKESTRR